MDNIGSLAGKVKRPFVFFEWTPSLAYVLGMYLGDGRVDSTKQWFQVTSIDKDSLIYLREQASTFLNDLKEVKTKQWGCSKKPIHVFRIASVQFCNWLLEVTKNKTIVPIPNEKCDITKSFLEGYLEAEGWVAISKKVYNSRQGIHHRFHMGFAGTDLWVDYIADLLCKQGVLVGKRQYCQIRKNWQKCIMYGINIKSFVNSGMKFHSARKQNRIDLYLKEQGLLTSTETVC